MLDILSSVRPTFCEPAIPYFMILTKEVYGICLSKIAMIAILNNT